MKKRFRGDSMNQVYIMYGGAYDRPCFVAGIGSIKSVMRHIRKNGVIACEMVNGSRHTRNENGKIIQAEGKMYMEAYKKICKKAGIEGVENFIGYAGFYY